MVDDEDFEEIAKYRWSLSANGYARRSFMCDGKLRHTYIHRQLLGLSYRDKMVIDHIDGDKLNNQRSNIRVCTVSSNMFNRGKLSNNKSGYKGVSWNKKSSAWQAQIRFNKKHKFLGLFSDPAEAHEVYCLAADLLHGEFANHGTKEVCHAE